MSENSKYRRVKNREPFATTINLGYGKTLADISNETRIPKSKLVDEALELLFYKYNKTYNKLKHWRYYMSTKKKLTIYINEDVLKEMKILAVKLDCSLSELTESLYVNKLKEYNEK